MMKLLGLHDSPTKDSGFARVAQNLDSRWHRSGVSVDVWGIGFGGLNYKRCPYVNEIFPAGGGGDWATGEKFLAFLRQIEAGGYSHVFMMQDTFQLSRVGFPEALKGMCGKHGVRSLYYFPVDATLEPAWVEMLGAVDVPVAYTEWGRSEAQVAWGKLLASDKCPPWLAGAPMPEIHVVPHGVDTKVYRPMMDRLAARKVMWPKQTGWWGDDVFIMLNVNAHQRRKDCARSLEILAGLKARGIPAKLVMHMRESSEGALSLEGVAAQLGLVMGQDWGHHNQVFQVGSSKMSEEELVRMYNASDLYLTTTLGEGWGLGITEALACGLPVAVPMHTACAEIATEVGVRGMQDRVVGMAVERNGVYQEFDLSRRRFRTDVEDAVDKIAAYYDSGKWRERPALTTAVKDWLSWDRIAASFLTLMRKPKAKPAVAAPSRIQGQTREVPRADAQASVAAGGAQ